MNWIQQIKTRIGRYLLKSSQKVARKANTIPHFDQIHDIGLIYFAGNKTNEEHVNRIAHYLREQGKKVWMMGYVDALTLPHSKKFHISSEYFWKEKLTPFNLPDTTKIGNFLSHRFDLMMNLYFEQELPLQAMSTYAKSAYAIGAQMPECLSYNDSIIDTGSDQGLQNLATQMIHYLKVINQK